MGVKIKNGNMTIKEKLENFPRVYWLSLPESLERHDFIINQFNKYGIKHKLVEPYNGKLTDYMNSSIVKVGYLTQEDEYGNIVPIMNSGITAVSMSHLKMIKEWYDNSDESEEYGFMGEDDMLLNSIDSWNFTWNDVINKLPKNWEIVQLNIIRGEGMSNKYMKFQLRFQYNWGGAAYIIKRSWAKYIIEKYIENDIYVFEGKDFYVPLPENIFYGIVRYGAYSLPLFTENTKFGRTLYPKFFKNNHESNNVYSANVCINWWKDHINDNQLELLFTNPIL